MTGIVVLIFMGRIVYSICQTVKPAPDGRPKCSVCGTTTRALQWIKSWEDWYCWRCKEDGIHAILDALIGKHA
jgi:hypothetical protein